MPDYEYTPPDEQEGDDQISPEDMPDDEKRLSEEQEGDDRTSPEELHTMMTFCMMIKKAATKLRYK